MVICDVRPETTRVKPFLKWAGGKRWFVTHLSELIPESFNRYFEPFLGGGAVFFHLKPENAVLNDANSELIDTYRAIKEDYDLVYRNLLRHRSKHCKEYYYQVRGSKPRALATRAARLIYLNRTCWNGLYRVNMSGQFNVPIGTKNSVIYDDDNFSGISRTLQGADLISGDFEDVINQAGRNDLIFADPPYTVRHNNNAFVKYNEKLFSWEDQERLCRALTRARERGVHVVATNACHKCLKSLYGGTFKTLDVSRNSSISSDSNTRGKFKELIIFTG